MAEAGDEITLRGGERVVVRPIRPDDKDGLLEGFHRLSPESRYRRFFSPMPELGAAQLQYLTEVDHRAHEALVAIAEDTEEPLGVARFVRSGDDPETAEVAVVVVDDWQGRGLGSELLRLLADRARAVGVKRFSALVLERNRPMLELLDDLGELERVHRDGGAIELLTDLPEEGAPAGMHGAVRAAARGELTVEGRQLPPTAGG